MILKHLGPLNSTSRWERNWKPQPWSWPLGEAVDKGGTKNVNILKRRWLLVIGDNLGFPALSSQKAWVAKETLWGWVIFYSFASLFPIAHAFVRTPCTVACWLVGPKCESYSGMVAPAVSRLLWFTCGRAPWEALWCWTCWFRSSVGVVHGAVLVLLQCCRRKWRRFSHAPTCYTHISRPSMHKHPQYETHIAHRCILFAHKNTLNHSPPFFYLVPLGILWSHWLY